MTTKQQKAASRWERLVRQECAVLREDRLARVDKNWEAPVVPGTHIPREKSKPDFSGFLCTDARHVVFEAKSVEETTRFDFNHIAEHQWEELQEAHFAGALSFVYVLGGDGRRWVISWRRIIHWEAQGRSSYPFQIDLSGTPVETNSRQLGEWRRKGAAFIWHGENWLETLQRLGEI